MGKSSSATTSSFLLWSLLWVAYCKVWYLNHLAISARINGGNRSIWLFLIQKPAQGAPTEAAATQIPLSITDTVVDCNPSCREDDSLSKSTPAGQSMPEWKYSRDSKNNAFTLGRSCCTYEDVHRSSCRLFIFLPTMESQRLSSRRTNLWASQSVLVILQRLHHIYSLSEALVLLWTRSLGLPHS
jgi:hypothetical protein